MSSAVPQSYSCACNNTLPRLSQRENPNLGGDTTLKDLSCSSEVNIKEEKPDRKERDRTPDHPVFTHHFHETFEAPTQVTPVENIKIEDGEAEETVGRYLKQEKDDLELCSGDEPPHSGAPTSEELKAAQGRPPQPLEHDTVVDVHIKNEPPCEKSDTCWSASTSVHLDSLPTQMSSMGSLPIQRELAQLWPPVQDCIADKSCTPTPNSTGTEYSSSQWNTAVDLPQGADHVVFPGRDIYDDSEASDDREKLMETETSGYSQQYSMPNENFINDHLHEGIGSMKEPTRRPYHCTFCNKSFTKSSHLKEHTRTHTGERPFQCTLCEKRFMVNSHLRNHMKTHTRMKPYKCTICDQSFRKNGQFDRHMRTHSGHKPYLCTMCGRGLASKDALRVHMGMHTGEKPYHCTTCDKRFLRGSHFKAHVRTHTGEKPYMCTKCDKRFTDASNLTKHMKIHTGEKPYQCKTCNKSFVRKCHFQDHVRSHTGERPYQCTLCEKRFTVKCNLTKHMRTHTCERRYHCTTCDKWFRESTHLKTHMRTHTGEKPYHCDICDKSFTVRSNATKHMRTHLDG